MHIAVNHLWAGLCWTVLCLVFVFVFCLIVFSADFSLRGFPGIGHGLIHASASRGWKPPFRAVATLTAHRVSWPGVVRVPVERSRSHHMSSWIKQVKSVFFILDSLRPRYCTKPFFFPLVALP